MALCRGKCVLLVFPDRFSLFQECLQPLLGVVGLHELIEIAFLGGKTPTWISGCPNLPLSEEIAMSQNMAMLKLTFPPGKREIERRSFIDLAFGPHPSAVTRDDAVYNGETHACSLKFSR